MFTKIDVSELGEILLVNHEEGRMMKLDEALAGLDLYKELLIEEPKEESKAAQQKSSKPKEKKKNKEKARGAKKRIDRGKVKALFEGGWPIEEIAAEMRCHPISIKRIVESLREEGVLG